ncbi:hypothetical protein SLA2020_452070 [Shorea laevis]
MKSEVCSACWRSCIASECGGDVRFKEGFRKLRPKRSENRKPRAITREGCKAMIVVKKEKTGKWIVTRFVKEHNHPLVATPANGRRSVLLSQTPVSAQLAYAEVLVVTISFYFTKIALSGCVMFQNQYNLMWY